MATLTKHALSFGLSGRGIPITATAVGDSNRLHAAGYGMDNFDEVWIYGTNSAETIVDVTLIWGLSATADLSLPDLGNADKMVIQTGAKTRTPLANGRLLQNGLSAYAFCETGLGTELIIDGYVNRITA